MRQTGWKSLKIQLNGLLPLAKGFGWMEDSEEWF